MGTIRAMSLLVAAFACCGAQGIDRFQPGDAIPEGQGAVILYLWLPPPTKTFWKNLDWSVRVERVGDGKTITLPNANTPQIYLLPVGRYLFRVARTADGGRVAGVPNDDAWFEVTAGKINYAGAWRLGGHWGTQGMNVTFEREPIDKLNERFSTEFKRYELWLAPLGRAPYPLSKPAAVAQPAQTAWRSNSSRVRLRWPALVTSTSSSMRMPP